jgi:predicted TIM-barrel fold metal-dependent hydrolase
MAASTCTSRKEPIMIIDVHTHLFHDRARHQREECFSSEPAFQLLYDSPNATMAGVDDLVAMMDEQEVDLSVTFGFPWQTSDNAREGNDYILEAVQRFPDRLVGFACVDPFWPGAAREVERCLDAGLQGVGELAFYRSGIDSDCLDRLEPVMELCHERNLPLMMHTNEPVGHRYPGKTPNTLAQIYGMVKRFPDNRLILAHWGGGLPFYYLLKKEVREVMANVWYDTAASPYLYDPAVYRAVGDIAGFDRILLGTDYPLLKPQRYLHDMEAAGLGEAEREAIGGGNAANLLGLGQ